MASSNTTNADKYRSFLSEDDVKNVKWRYGSAPNYDKVNKLFEEGRTKVWPPGSLEDTVQKLVKTWEMEMFNKLDSDDYRAVDAEKYRFILNGRKALSLEEKKKAGGGYISLLQTSLPEKYRCFNPDEETVETANHAFTTTFPRGFALEVLEAFSGPPVFVYKFRHWGYMEGPFKAHPPTGELVEFFGMSIFEVDENSKIVRVEFFYDRGELLAGLVKDGVDSASGCPVFRNIG